MPPPLLLRRTLPTAPLCASFLTTQIRHSSFVKASIDKKVLVQLTKNVPKLGSRGDVVSVHGGRMRNVLYPYSMAQYIHPGAETYLTTNKLAIPVGPNYRRRLRKSQPDPLREEHQDLFEKAKARLQKEQMVKSQGRDVVMHKLNAMRRKVEKSSEWKGSEKQRLLRFLGTLLDSWGTLEDNSTRVRKMKEQIFLQAWGEFTEKMMPKEKTWKAKKDKGLKKKAGEGLEAGTSTKGTTIQGDVKVLKEGIETVVGTDGEPVGQTVLHSDSHTVLVPQVGEVELSPFAIWDQQADAVAESVDSTPPPDLTPPKPKK